MTLARSSAVAALVLLVAYQLMRQAAAACSGAACDAFIGPSLALPLAALLTAGLAGGAAAASAGGLMRGFLIAATLASTAGPLLALAVFKDRPDDLVPMATVLIAVAPAAALAYSFRRASLPRAR